MVEVTAIECEHCVYTDVGVSKNSAEDGIYETHSISLELSFGLCKHTFIRIEAIGGII